MATNSGAIYATNRRSRYIWFLPCLAALNALIFGVAVLASRAFDLLEIAYILIGVPVISLIFLGAVFFRAWRSKRRPSLPVFLVLPAYWAVTWLLFANQYSVRDNVRWALYAKEYKANLLKQSAPSNSDLRHVEWDGWGFVGTDTNVYLVFDPDDSLANPAKNHSSGKFRGISCPVPRIRRLESHWYAVTYYTNSIWDQCI